MKKLITKNQRKCKARIGSMIYQDSILCTTPDLILLKIVEFLPPLDIIHLSQTCKQLHQILPSYLIISASDFEGHVHTRPHFCPEKWFDGPKIDKKIRSIVISFKWKDQGWGNRKGNVWLKIIREGEVILETSSSLCGLAEHKWGEVNVYLGKEQNVVSQFKPGDKYRFMQNVGGGGGHSLYIKNFEVALRLENEDGE